MKRNVLERALQTAWQAAAATFLAEVGAGLTSGDFGVNLFIIAGVTALATFFSAAKSTLQNQRREGPDEE